MQSSNSVINSSVIGQIPVFVPTDNLDITQVPVTNIQNNEILNTIQVNKVDMVMTSANNSVPMAGLMHNQANIPSSFAGYQIQNQGKE